MSAPLRDKPTPGLVWPKPGVVTWIAPALYLGGNCSGSGLCATGDACQIGLTLTLDSGICGCECPCHVAARERAETARASELDGDRWWLTSGIPPSRR